MLYATVPAFNFLWSREDVDAGHVRRYTLDGISEALGRAGLDVVFASYIFALFRFPSSACARSPIDWEWAKQSAARLEWRGIMLRPAPSSPAAINAILDPEVRNLEARKAMRFGGSCLVVARAS
ncbi:MAG: hypothetical protein ABI520_14070 [Caldimonas sp.]